MNSGIIHAENREWAFASLDVLQAYLDDEDFHGDSAEARTAIERKREELRESKYQVVFLGAFNVGKSTLINALIGNEYLPSVLEECTAKITHVVKADEMKTVISLTESATDAELQSLSDLLAGYGVETQLSQTSERYELVIAYQSNMPRELRTSLNALITMGAEEDFPQLRTLRAKFDEIFLYLPDVTLEDDIALIDSPGVHSMSESNTKLTQDIIPHSHLVVCLIDSQSAGSKQDRGFIEMIVKHRLRKVLFVMNKSDQLNAEEIDARGHRGPAKDLFRGLEGVVEAPELFFISSLYALIAGQLEKGHIGLDALDTNNKIKIPFSAQRSLLKSESPEQEIAAYLKSQSGFDAFKNRLLDYLYHENREGAILESVCRFLAAEAWKFVRPLEIQLEMARNVPRLDELTRLCNELSEALDKNRWQANEFVGALDALAGGGRLEGVSHAGYGMLADGLLTTKTIEAEVLAPLQTWLQNKDNFRKARRSGYKLVQEEMEQTLDRFLARVYAELNQEMERLEHPYLERLDAALENNEQVRPNAVTALPPKLLPIRTRLGASYTGFFLMGAAICAALGFALTTKWAACRAFLETALTQYPQVGECLKIVLPCCTLDQTVLVGLIVGGVLGALGGILLRKLTATNAQRKKVTTAMIKQINQVLVAETCGDSGSIKTQLRKNIEQRRTDLLSAVQNALDAVAARITEKLDAAKTEEEALRRTQAEIIARIEPKTETLKTLMETARQIAEAHTPKHSTD